MADQKGGRAMSREALERIYCLKSRVPAYLRWRTAGGWPTQGSA